MPTKKKAAPSGTTKTVRVATEAHKIAKVYAAAHDMEIGEVLEQAIEEYIKKHGA